MLPANMWDHGVAVAYIPHLTYLTYLSLITALSLQLKMWQHLQCKYACRPEQPNQSDLCHSHSQRLP